MLKVLVTHIEQYKHYLITFSELLVINVCIGVDEETYWDRLLVSRQLKRSRERPKARGRQKLAAKATEHTCQNCKQHIKFNEDF